MSDGPAVGATTGASRSAIDGYVGGANYPSLVHPTFTVPWTDAILAREGYRAPRSMASGGAFTLVDLGCGDGVGLVLQAAACPHGHFVGIDVMPGHIEHGRKMATLLGVDNVELRCASFADALAAGDLQADYISCQGVLSWISPANRDLVFALLGSCLKPGGAATLGYNSQPGWAQFLAYQKALRELAGDAENIAPETYFANAHGRLREVVAAGARSVRHAHLEKIDELRERLPHGYFPHEYLNDHWQPLWSCDVIRELDSVGLSFVHTALPHYVRRDFVLRAAQRDQVGSAATVSERELLFDLFMDCQFRTDVFVRNPAGRCDDTESEGLQMQVWWMLTDASVACEYSAPTAAGTLRFDNEAARAIVGQLDSGPCNLGAVASASGIAAPDLLNAADALFLAGMIEPVDAPRALPGIERQNRMIVEQSHGLLVNALLTPCGPVRFKHADIQPCLGSEGWRRRLGMDWQD